MTGALTAEADVVALDRPNLTMLVADELQQAGIERLKSRLSRVEVDAGLTAETLPRAIAEIDPDILLVRSTKVTAAALEAATSLSLIIRAGAGYDSIDVAAASARGVSVANCPGKNALAVAELAWALILACDRRVPDQTADIRRGSWDKKGYGKARGLYGRTLGVIGLGRIGMAVAERGKAFGMHVIAWSRSLTGEQAEAMSVGFCASPIDVARKADVISLHVASTPETRHLVDDAFCDAMKPGAYLINTTRGEVVDERALALAVQEKSIRAGLDVYDGEPAGGDSSFTNPIVDLPGVFGTHHVGASTDQAQEAIADEAVRIAEVYSTTGDVCNCVNRSLLHPAECMLTIRHLNRAGVLAHVFQVLSAGSINVEEMENIIYEGGLAARARIHLESIPTPAQLDEIRRNEKILNAVLTPMPA